MTRKKSIFDFTPDSLKKWLISQNEKPFRASQILDWVYKHKIASYEEMQNIPQELRKKLQENFSFNSLECLEKQIAKDQTTKFLFKLVDGETIETVIIIAPDRQTVCISTQVGCPVGCHFCASGVDGLLRNLQPSEIIEQVYFAAQHLGKNPSNIVVMGMGEPLLNWQNLFHALETIRAPWGMKIGTRSVTVSTSGIVPGLKKLIEYDAGWNLALSLHAPDDALRSKLIPEKMRYSLKEILALCRQYCAKTGRKLTFEYTLMKGENDSIDVAEKVADIAKNCRAKVNLIPYNDVSLRFKQPSKQTIKAFAHVLSSRKIPVTIRMEKGQDIKAACGQLRQMNQRDDSTFSS